MIIKLKETECIDAIREILSSFSSHTLDEIIGYFPQYKYRYIKTAIDILVRKHDIEVKNLNGVEYYSISQKRINRSSSYDDRESLKPALDFVRAMISETDENGLLKNEVTYICRADFFTLSVDEYRVVKPSARFVESPFGE